MSKVVLADTISGYNLSVINSNFDKIEEALNDKVLYRNNPDGEPNSMVDPLDMNGQRIINLPVPGGLNDAARMQDIVDATAGITNAAAMPFSPTGTIAATNVQGAVAEVATDAATALAGLVSDLANTATAAKGDSQIGYSTVYTTVSGVRTRYASINAAVTGLGATVGTIVVNHNSTLTGSVTIPTTATLKVTNSAIINFGGFVLTVNGKFKAYREQVFTGTGSVVFGKTCTVGVLPEWWGAKTDTDSAGLGTDSTAAWTAAITASTDPATGTVAIREIKAANGNYLVSNLVFPPASTVRGNSRHVTNFFAKDGTTGKWITDNGSASKIIFEKVAFYGRSLSGITHGVQLGRNGVEHGTEGYLKDIWVRDITATNAIALDVLSNVGIYTGIVVQNCYKGFVLGGSPSHCSEVVVMQPVSVGMDSSYATITGLHIEAPGNGCIPLKLSRNSIVQGLSISLANSTTISHLIELDAATTNWNINQVEYFFGSSPGTITVSNGNIKRADGTYFGGNATGGSTSGNGSFSSDTAGQTLQNFTLRIVNTAGTLQHRIATPTGGAAKFASKVSGASPTLANTPTGADGSTAMASGGKIGSASTSTFIFDVSNQIDTDSLFILSDVYSTTGDVICAIPSFASININGVTRTRLTIQFFLETTGGAFALNTSNIAAGEFIQVSFYGHLS